MKIQSTLTKSRNLIVGKMGTYNRKSCSQAGLAPLTVIVVDLTFCNWRVTYVLSWLAVLL